MPEFMTAVDIESGSGPATSLYLNSSTPLPSPLPGQALVRISAFGLNRMDLLQRNGAYPVPLQAPSTLGVEFSGTIIALGPGSHDPSFTPGTEVFGLAYGGAYAEYIAVSSKMLLHKPPFLSMVQAAGIPETFFTATQALHFVLQVEASKEKSILWHAGASGVSIAGIQLSKVAGLKTIYATAGTDEKCRFLEKELGVTKAVNYKEGDWVAEIAKATGAKGVDYIVDFVGGEYFGKNLEVVARDGRICMLGLMGGRVVEKVDIGSLLYKRVRLEGSTLRSRDEEYQGRLRDTLEAMLGRFGTGELQVFLDTVFSWKDIVKAHQLLEENKTMGKIICMVD
ncbi:quinone oxidoreductase [Podospora aff. communis PSN243]|uniref:Quinone oxidoreductase n=1 Tax=Podospora aff. communis PSN243 TaxID=3040156 RepID=A0AAV9GXK2_9PEZI|nr:quinone oxidoreductase [Podospora aff. communis PSN243]